MEQATAERIRQPKIIDRPRLTRQLDASGARIVLLIAPAGYGKTTLAREWLRDRTHAWFTATAASVDVAALATGVAHAMQKVVPRVGERMLTRLRLSTLPSAEAEVFADMLAEDLAKWPEDAWLVVDDYQAISGTEPCETFFSLLVARCSANFLVTSRVQPTWASGRSRLYGTHFELDARDLAMTSDEASQIVADPSTRKLVKGWPALVSLAATASVLPHETLGDSAELHAFLADELFRSTPPEIQRALCQLSMCPDLPIETASSFLGVPSSSEALQLGADFGFLSIANDTVSLHPLIRKFLRGQGRTVLGDYAGERRRLAAFLIDQKCWDEAFAVIEEVGSAPLLSRLLKSGLSEMLSAGRHATIGRWVSLARELPGETSPTLLLAEAELASREGRQVEAEALAAQAARSSHDQTVQARAWNLAGRSAHLLDRYARALEYHRHAEDLAVGSIDLREAIWGQIIASWQVEPDLSELLLPRLARAGGDELETRLRLANATHFIALRSRHLDEIAAVMDDALILANHAANPVIVTSFLNAAARWQAIRGFYREAAEIVEREMQVAQQHRLAFVLPNALNVRAIALTGLRDWGGAARALNAAEAHARDYDDIHNQVDAHAIRLRLLLSRGDAARALSLADRTWPRLAGRAQELEFKATAALVSAVAGDPADSASVVASIDHATSAEVRSVMHAAGAVSGLRLGKRDGVDALTAYYARSGAVDPVVIAWRAFPPLLEAMLAGEGFGREAAVIAARTRDRLLARKLDLPVSSDRRDEPQLSKRECEVHELMAQGLTNREIARLLYIQEVTVKLHVRHILAKLGVRTRVEAATRFVKD